MRKLTLAYYNSMLHEVSQGATIVGGLSWQKAKQLAKSRIKNHNSTVSLRTPECVKIPDMNYLYRAGNYNNPSKRV